jgi:predicted SnoaL-like aldol condensation-catalyzing enzyme
MANATPLPKALAVGDFLELSVTAKRKAQICTLLKGIETGDAASVAVVNPNKYIQHNPQTQEGGEGLAALFKRLSKSSPQVNIVRIFSDGDYVFGHTEYDFGTSRIGFEVFRFEDDLTVEHWDNIQARKGPSPSGHSMVDGDTGATDLDKTEVNRELIRGFVDSILIGGQIEKLSHFVDADSYTEHNPGLTDGIASLHAALTVRMPRDGITLRYDRRHRLLAEGNFVLSVCEGFRDDNHTSFYDLYRIADGKIVEHWDTTETVPPQSEWKNENGKF